MKPHVTNEFKENKNVIVIPELYANPLLNANLMSTITIPQVTPMLTPAPSLHTTPLLKATETIVEIPEAPLLSELDNNPSIIAASLD